MRVKKWFKSLRYELKLYRQYRKDKKYWIPLYPMMIK